MRYPGTIVVEILDPIPADLPRKEFRAVLETRIETAASRLIVEAAASPDPPPIAADVLARARSAPGPDADNIN
jgi:1-acyl-sn-glycerol-3-phosphate acyltransferase